MDRSATLRVIDFGTVTPLRSQTLWHAIASGVSAGGPPTLAFCRPGGRYVSIGFHRSIDELDPEMCGPTGLAVFRRMVGGGPVYIDPGQLFFQMVVPADWATARRGETIRRLLEPAVAAFRDVGIPASFDDEIVLGDRKICGHAGGQIGGALVAVGNVIDSFDHAAAASIVRAPAPEARDEYLRQMRRFVAATPTDFDAFVAAATHRYADAFALDPFPGDLDATERRELDRLDRLFVDPEWVGGVEGRRRPWWRVKVTSKVWVTHARIDALRVTAAFREGRVRSVRVCTDDGVSVATRNVEEVMRRFGAPRIGELLEEMAAGAPA